MTTAMTTEMLDREQIKRETTVLRHKFAQRRARGRPDIIEHYHDEPNCELCALLAALDQAERERDEAKHQRDNFERIAREQATAKHALWLWRNEHEPLLAKVPALVEALRYYAVSIGGAKAREALADCEGE